ncbi:ABC transporter substrate-binding protein [Natronorubrum thiooxidans]|uniref:Iron complex transport system substrate-binding protein n=1 Tax=Natronorubrum thiooxidans TaxID=308853 RepID=A0A1N7GN32_9EURY|nr:ABC transporter substrate-binding protein [Natronorubrum thiooxidans]SIS13994.1 iron complex transport system substrate-binding protein [Natronorubrum thiooxidans]
MSDNDSSTVRHEAPTRREYVKYGGVVVTGGLLAGCTGGNNSPTPDPESETETTEQKGYDAAIEPYGRATFDRPPETYATIGGAWTDFGFAFASEPTAISNLAEYPTRYYEQLPGVSFDTDGIINLGPRQEYGKEQFYELDVDMFLMDRILVANYAGWDEGDFEEITENVAPFTGSYIRNEWNGEEIGLEFEFPYYTFLEAISLAGELFNDPERATAFRELHEDFVSLLKSAAPESNPSAGLLYSASTPADGQFMIADPTVDGVATRQYRLFGVENAFAGIDLTDGWKTDYEGMLEADPEYIFVDSTLSIDRETFEEQFVTPLEESAVGSELTAVTEGNIFRGGGRYQGPVISLFVSEILAKQLYPDLFGEFPTLIDIPQDEQLFDRQRVADIINGDI